jgi:hypothetical protein
MSIEENSTLSWLIFEEGSSILNVELPSLANWFLKILNIIDFEAAGEDPCRVIVKAALQAKIFEGSSMMLKPRTYTVFQDAKAKSAYNYNNPNGF